MTNEMSALCFINKIIQANHVKELNITNLFKNNLITNFELYSKIVEYNNRKTEYKKEEITDVLISQELGFELHKEVDCQNSMCEIGRMITDLLSDPSDEDINLFVECLGTIQF